MFNKILLITTALSISIACFAAEETKDGSHKQRSVSPFDRADDLRQPELQAAPPPVYAAVTYPDLAAVITDRYRILAFQVALETVIEKDRNEVGHLALQLITPDANSEEITDIICKLNVIAADRPTFVDQVRQLIRPDTNVKALIEVVTVLGRIKAADRPTFVDQVRQLIRPDTDVKALIEVVTVLGRIKAADRPTFVNQVQQLIKPDMNAEALIRVVTVLGRIKAADRPTFVNQVQQLIRPYMNAEALIRVVSALSNVLAFDRPAFVDQVQQLIKPDMDSDQIYLLIEVCSLTKAVNRTTTFINQVQQLIRITPAMQRIPISHYIHVLSRVSAAYRTAFIDQVKQFIRPDMNEHDIIEVTDSFSRVDDAYRNAFVDQVKQFISLGVHDIFLITNYLLRVDAVKRPNRVARTLLFMRGGNNTIIGQILETPLNQQIRLGNMNDVAQGANPYAAGINVHAEGRDRRAVEAAHSLYEVWKPTPGELDAAHADFLRAVGRLDESLQARALRSLGIDKNGNVLPKPANESFSGLIAGVNEGGTFALSGGGKSMNVNGREIVARFWHFANTYTPDDVALSSNSSSSGSSNIESDRQNMRAGIMDALVRGVNDHNTLRCEMGRVQLLELATVQGRLRDTQGRAVDIDDLGLNPEIAGTHVAAVPEHVEHAQPTMITNLDEIAHLLQPFVNSLGGHITTAEQFYTELFSYINRLAAGGVTARGERIHLDPASVVYFVRMMSPAVFSGGRIVVPARINPQGSLAALFGFGDAFLIYDYERQFGERDRVQFEAARRIEEDRALREQQDREYAAGLEHDRIRFKQRDAATTIQRVVRGNSGRSQAAALRTETAQKRMIEEQKRADESARPQTKEELRALRMKAFDDRLKSDRGNGG